MIGKIISKIKNNELLNLQTTSDKISLSLVKRDICLP